jgi:hypothetical protein
MSHPRWVAYGTYAAILANALGPNEQLYVIPVPTQFHQDDTDYFPLDLGQYSPDQRARLAAYCANHQRWYRSEELQSAAIGGRLELLIPSHTIRVNPDRAIGQIQLPL